MKNKNYRKLLTTFLVVALISSGIYLYVNANEADQQHYYNIFDTAYGHAGRVEAEINRAEVPLGQMGAIQEGLKKELGKNESNSRKNVAKSILDRIGSSFTGAVKTLIDQLSETMTGVDLVQALEAVNDAIEEYIRHDIGEKIFERSETGYDATWDRILEFYGKLEGKHLRDANMAVFGENTDADLSERLAALKWSLPDATKIYVSQCANPSGTCYGYYTDANEHLETCSLKHGPSGETNVTYWKCDNRQTCSRASEHWIECQALCGDFFPPPVVNDETMTRAAPLGTPTAVYNDHYKVCEEPIHSIWNGIFGYQAKCGKTYYTCEGGCSHREDEGVFYNKTSFEVYETLAVRVIKDDLYMATMVIDGDTVTSYPGSGNALTLRHTFDSGDMGQNFTVTINVWYGDTNAPNSSIHSSCVSVNQP